MKTTSILDKDVNMLRNAVDYYFIQLTKKNHLSGITCTYLRVNFNTIPDLLKVCQDLMAIIKKNKPKQNDLTVNHFWKEGVLAFDIEYTKNP